MNLVNRINILSTFTIGNCSLPWFWTAFVLCFIHFRLHLVWILHLSCQGRELLIFVKNLWVYIWIIFILQYAVDITFWFVLQNLVIHQQAIHLFVYKLFIIEFLVVTFNLRFLIFILLMQICLSVFWVCRCFLLSSFLIFKILLEIYSRIYRIYSLRSNKSSLGCDSFKFFDLLNGIRLFGNVYVFDDNSVSFASLIEIKWLCCFTFQISILIIFHWDLLKGLLFIRNIFILCLIVLTLVSIEDLFLIVVLVVVLNCCVFFILFYVPVFSSVDLVS